jgi:hypothetical protein
LPGFAAVVKREVASRARHTVGEGTSGSPPTRTPPMPAIGPDSVPMDSPSQALYEAR